MDSDALLLQAKKLRVRFAFSCDRFRHWIECFDGAVWIAALESVEGSPDDDWPRSPPFQSQHQERTADGCPVVLLVGMAGTSHWSASVELDSAADCLRFDVACRARPASLGRLASTYRAVGAAKSLLRIERCVELAPIDLVWQAEELSILPSAARLESAQTIRWGYTIARSV